MPSPQVDVLNNTFKKNLKEGKLQIGLWSSLGSNVTAEILAAAGFHWVLMDTEHSPNETPGLVSQLQAFLASDTAPIVRPAWNDPVLIKRLMDIGFHNILIPFVQTGEEAAAAVAATRYPPDGIRGVSVGGRGSRYGTVKNYWHEINNQMGVIVQVENQKALDNLDAISNTDGVDCVFVGPNDLAASMGHIVDVMNADVQKTIAGIAQTVIKAGKAPGILAGSPAEAQGYIHMGYTFVGVGSDNGAFKNAVTGLASQFIA